ncbi:MAG: hypothetical protein U0271_21245 [Polyangiaceae bacterium]
MGDFNCAHCGAVRKVGHVYCGYCRNPYSAELARTAIPCAHCRTLSTSDQTRCVSCGNWIVVQCVFCGGVSPYTFTACSRCGELFAGAAERKAKRDAHDHDDEEEDDGWEAYWAWCRRCQCLVYDEDPPGPCAAGGAHDTSDSEAYWLCTDKEEIDGQGGFHWCGACQCLYRGAPQSGLCAATRGPHQGSADEYFVARDGDEDEDYGGWSLCKRCNVLHWSESKGVCAAGGPHDGRGSSNWEVWHEDDE